MSSHLPDARVSDAVRAFRQLTEEDGPTAALTRSRLLTRAQGKLRHRRGITIGLAIATFFAILGGIAVARLLPQQWRTNGDVPATRRERSASAFLAPKSATAPLADPTPTAAPPAEPSLPIASAATRELSLYGAAHAVHFVAHDAARALRLWSQYLRQFPTGRFVPEATYNRALALLRLGREREALAALRTIAAGRFGAYRRADAAALITALGVSSNNAP